MEKTLNLLVYLPGHAGHFISIILSVDDYTFSPSLSNIKNPIQELSYTNLIWKYGSWKSFHDNYSVDPWQGIEEFVNQNEKSMFTTLFHPSRYDTVLKNTTSYLNQVNVNWLIVKLSDELEYINDDFKKRNGNWPKTSLHDIQRYDYILKTHNPYIINLDNIFFGVDTFVEEYYKLCDHLGLNKNVDIVLPYYKNWYKERKLHNYNF